MKISKIVVLVVITLVPLCTLMIFDFRYNSLHDRLCRNYPEYSYYCDYPERYERERLVTTAFYRHLGSYLGRSEGTSYSFISSVRSSHANNPKSFFNQYEVERSLGKFNLSFLIAILGSVVVASVSLTVLMQKLARDYLRVMRKNRSADKRSFA